jgi:DNA-binding NarL/FixJ family response regulator
MKIAIIEDNNKYRESLATSLSLFPDCNVIHELSNALHIEKKFAENLPDVAIVDINMPGLSGVDGIKEIVEKFPTVQCVMLTVNVDLDMVLKCMQAGAKGYLIKDKDSIVKIVESIRILVNGNYNEEFPLNGTIASKILKHFAKQEKSFDQRLEEYNLTTRQIEVLKMLYEGKSYKQIANECGISIDTLNSHIKAIYPKLNINSRGEIRNLLG